MADNPKLQELLKALQEAESKPYSAERAASVAASLRARFDLFVKEHRFAPGTLAVWKPGLRNKKKPEYGEPVIVIEHMADPIYGGNDNSGTPYFREPLDLAAGFVDSDGDFIQFYFDSRRFQPFES